MSKELGELVVKQCKPNEFKNEVDIVFSGLDSDVAGETGKDISYTISAMTLIQLLTHHEQRKRSSRPAYPSSPTQRTIVNILRSHWSFQPSTFHICHSYHTSERSGVWIRAS